MNLLLLVCIAFVLLHARGLSVHGQHSPKTTKAVRIAKAPPRIDGILDDEVWREAPAYQDFVQGTPDEGQVPTETTTFQLAYDDQALYIGVMAYDRESDKIVARLARRDQRTEADWIQVTIDAHHDHQTGYVLEINAAGSLRDGLVYNDGNAYDRTWDGVWEAQRALLPNGWSVEYKIPYHVLRLDTRGGPLILRMPGTDYRVKVDSDTRTKLNGWLEVQWKNNEAGSTWRAVGGGLNLRLTSAVEIQLRPRYQWIFNDAQWVQNGDVDADGTDDRFVYGQLHSKTVDLPVRANFIFRHNLSLEAYVQPFVAVGDYENFKELAQPGTYEFAPYALAENPDFRRRSMRGNLVLRWEYRPGSALFLVWSQSRRASSEAPRVDYLRNLARSFGDDGSNILLVKLSYWMKV